MARDKLLVANRGEICVRICRAARELGLQTVAIYAYEDRFSDHYRYATEAYQLGDEGEFEPREAYLNIDRIIHLAKQSKATLIHPGYGFLSEDERFAHAVEEAGLTFVGPSSTILKQLGNKVSARKIAATCNVPIVPGTEYPVTTAAEVSKFVSRYGFPIIAKAANGGGGRGQRVIYDGQDAHEAVREVQHEARQVFDDEDVFLEKFLPQPKHIEVQILGDQYGNVVHLFERDCTVQRRHQKIIEFAPALSLSTSSRQKLHEAALKIARHVKYQNAGTVEFLVQEEEIFFIEVNPRIQVEHTVTEEILNVDLIQAQIKIAQGISLADLGLAQARLEPRGVAIQCRVTSEDPSLGFMPSSGTITHCRLPTGPGIRTDCSNMFAGARITPHFDPLLFKCISHAKLFTAACAKLESALAECKIEGIESNLIVLERILKDTRFLSHGFSTRLLDDDKSLLAPPSAGADVTQGLITFLAEGLVNGTLVQGQTALPDFLGIPKTPQLRDASHNLIDVATPCSKGWRDLIVKKGPAAFARAVRKHPTTLISDTTMRDAQQSLLATRLRTTDLANIALHTSHAYAGAFSIECWGGATYDVALRFLHEDPWKRLQTLRKLMPNIPFQMLLRSVSGLAYSALPDNFLEFFVGQAVKNGIDIIRVFDGLNDIVSLEIAIAACLRVGAVVDGSLLYTGDLLDPTSKYSLQYYLDLIDRLVATGAHIVSVKSMTGVMKPEAGRVLVRSIRSRHPDIPIHMHIHDATGMGVATMLACAEAGADVIDSATDSLSGATSQPAATAILAGLMGTPFEAELNFDHVRAVDSYWAQLRLTYSGFDAKMTGPDPDVYLHEIPGGQLTNLFFQARELGLGDRWRETKEAFAAANKVLGDIVKATPTSKAVGDLAQFMVNSGLNSDDIVARADTLDFPESVLDYFQGLMGQPFDGFPEPLRTKALRGVRKRIDGAANAMLEPVDLSKLHRQLLAEYGPSITENDVCSHFMFPEVFAQYRRVLTRFGDLSWLPTRYFIVPMKMGEAIECHVPGDKSLTVKALAIQPPSEDSAKRLVIFEVSGEYRHVMVTDTSSGLSNSARRKADPLNPAEVGAAFSGTVSSITTETGASVSKGQTILSLNAMKMVLNVSAPTEGVVHDLSVLVGEAVDRGDLLFQVVPTV